MLSILCHYISKQWIGYYITMSNWNDDWLHIALNYFLQNECVNQVGTTFNDLYYVFIIRVRGKYLERGSSLLSLKKCIYWNAALLTLTCQLIDL